MPLCFPLPCSILVAPIAPVQNFPELLASVLPEVVEQLQLSVRPHVQDKFLDDMAEHNSIGKLTATLKSFAAICRA